MRRRRYPVSEAKHNPDSAQLPMFDPIVIPLTRGKQTVVDPVDVDLASRKWHALTAPDGRTYAAWRPSSTSRLILLHRIILERILARALTRSELVDHIDNNSLNNRRSNLRLATKPENTQNQKRRCDNTTGYKGVTIRPESQRYRAAITSNGKRYNLGTFDTPEEAYAAYCEAAKLLHGDFARLE